MSDEVKKSRVFDFRSLRFKSWLYYFLMTLLILAFFLVVQTVFFSAYYATMKREDIMRLGDNVVERYTHRVNEEEPEKINEKFKTFVDETKSTSGADIDVFKAKYTIAEGEVKVSSIVDLVQSGQYSGRLNIDENYFRILDEAVNQEKDVFNYETLIDSGSYLVYGAIVEDATDGTVYFRISSPLGQSEFILGVMLRQSVISTIICAFLSLGLSILLSNLITKPVTLFSKTARRLADGDFSVRFKSEGFSEIEDLADTLNFATEEMGKTDQLRRDLLANVSHDLRTPLTMVKAYAEMIRDLSGDDPKKRANHCQTIIDEADRLANLVNDIQDLSKLQSKTETLDLDEVDLSLLARMVMQRFDIFSHKEGYNLKTEIDDVCLIFADKNKIAQVLYNLIGNAINYTGKDKTVTVYVRNLTGKIYFGVKDTGKGIAKEETDAVWDRYYRASQSKRKRVGTGLGLSIVKSILTMHNAEYGIQSTLGEGTTFWFCLPEFFPFDS